MKLQLNNIPIEIMIRIKSVIPNAKNNNAYLPSQKPEFPIPGLYLVIAFFLFCIFLTFINTWSTLSTFVAFGIVVIFLLSRAIQNIWNWWALGKDAVFFDTKYFIAINRDELRIIPINDFLYSDVILSEGQYIARFLFKEHNTVFLASKEDSKYYSFQNTLKQVSDSAKNSKQDYNLAKTIPNNLRQYLTNRKTPIISAAFALIILWLIVPIIIDYNQYELAKKEDTATSYRNYLKEKNNIRYRDDSRTAIKGIYDKYINEYLTSSSGVSGAKSFKEVLEYLRDKDLYSVEMIFTPSSALTDIASNEYQIKSVTPSFTKEKNKLRQDQVAEAVKNTLGKIFPTDIITISNTNSVGEHPRFEIFYTYENNPESIYFPSEQSFLEPEKRTWFYGIVINWNFKISLKTKPFPIYEFNLLSEPSMHLTAQTLNSDDVYSSMATSAFNDFQNEFQKRFFNSK